MTNTDSTYEESVEFGLQSRRGAAVNLMLNGRGPSIIIQALPRMEDRGVVVDYKVTLVEDGIFQGLDADDLRKELPECIADMREAFNAITDEESVAQAVQAILNAREKEQN